MTRKELLRACVERLSEDQAGELLELIEARYTDSEPPWPASAGLGHSGVGDLAENHDAHLARILAERERRAG